mgnify:CR=1 FL=1
MLSSNSASCCRSLASAGLRSAPRMKSTSPLRSGEAHAIVVGDIAWVLVEEVEWVALYSGNYDRASNTVTDLTTRHDVGLGWVDYDQDVLAQGQELLRAALSADVGPVSVTVVADNGA